jgi:PAS domain S-box-containing protein
MADRKLKRLLESLLSDTPEEMVPGKAAPEAAVPSGERLDSWAKLERYALLLQTASQISHAASSILSLDELLPQAVDLIRRQFGFYYVGIFMLDASGEGPRLREDDPRGWAVLTAGTGEAGRQMIADGHRLQVGGDSMVGWCIAHQQARIALDVGDEAVRFDNPLLPDTRSEMALPLISRGQVIGAMTFQSVQPAAFSQEDISVLQSMADQLANAIENARLFADRERRIAELAIVNEVGQAVTSVLDLDMLLRQIVDTTKERFGHYFVGILLLEGDELVFRNGSLIGDSDVRWQSGGLRLALDGYGLTIATANSGQSILVNDVHADSRYGTAPGLEPVQAELDTPLIVKGQVLGVLTVQSDHLNAFDQDDVALLQSLASQAAVAIDNARLFDQARIHAQEMAILNEMGRALNTRLDVDTALYTLYRYASQLMDTTNFYVALYDAATETISFPLAVQAGEELKWASRHKGRGLSEYVLHTREPLLIAENVRAYIDEHLEGIEHIGVEAESWLGVPLTIGHQAIGVVAVQSLTTPRCFNERHRDLLTGIARQAAAAIENARLLVQTQQSAAQAQVLYETSRALSSHLEEEALMHAILEGVYRTLACEHATISIVDEEAGIIACRHIIWRGQFDVFPEWIRLVQYPLDHPDITPDIYRTGRTEIIAGWDERFNREIWDQFGHERLLRIFMPIKQWDRVLGVLEVGYDKKEKQAIDEQEVQLLSAFVDQAAIALQNAHLFDQLRDSERKHRLLLDSIQSPVLALDEKMTILYCNDAYVRFVGRSDADLEGQDLRAVLPRIKDSPPYRAYLQVLETGEPCQIEGTMGGDDGEPSRHMRAWVYRTPQGILTISEDITEQQRVQAEREQLLIETDALFRAGRQITTAQSSEQVLQALLEYTRHLDLDRGLVALLDDPHAAPIDRQAEVKAVWDRQGREAVFLGNRFSNAQIPLIGKLGLADVVRIDDFRTATTIDDRTRATFKYLGVGAACIVPIAAGGTLSGWFLAEMVGRARTFGDQEVSGLQSIAGLAAVAIQNLRQIEVSQATARREHLLREITTHVHTSTDPDTIMRTVVRDLGTALRRPVFIRLGSNEGLSGPTEAADGDGAGGETIAGRYAAREGGD